MGTKKMVCALCSVKLSVSEVYKCRRCGVRLCKKHSKLWDGEEILFPYRQTFCPQCMKDFASVMHRIRNMFMRDKRIAEFVFENWVNQGVPPAAAAQVPPAAAAQVPPAAAAQVPPAAAAQVPPAADHVPPAADQVPPAADQVPPAAADQVPPAAADQVPPAAADIELPPIKYPDEISRIDSYLDKLVGFFREFVENRDDHHAINGRIEMLMYAIRAFRHDMSNDLDTIRDTLLAIHPGIIFPSKIKGFKIRKTANDKYVAYRNINGRGITIYIESPDKAEGKILAYLNKHHDIRDIVEALGE